MGGARWGTGGRPGAAPCACDHGKAGCVAGVVSTGGKVRQSGGGESSGDATSAESISAEAVGGGRLREAGVGGRLREMRRPVYVTQATIARGVV
jgi:hypothetical protein